MIRSQLPEQEVPTAAQDHIEGAKVAVKFDLSPQPPLIATIVGGSVLYGHSWSNLQYCPVILMKPRSEML